MTQDVSFRFFWLEICGPKHQAAIWQACDLFDVRMPATLDTNRIDIIVAQTCNLYGRSNYTRFRIQLSFNDQKTAMENQSLPLVPLSWETFVYDKKNRDQETY